MAKAPGLFNGFMRWPVTETLSRRIFGMANMPPLSSPTLKQQLTGRFPAFTTIEHLKAMPEAQRRQHVLVVQDPFTSFYEAPLVTDLIRLITLLGYRPVLLPFTPNGKPQQVKGFLKRFMQTATRSADFLNKVAELGLPMIGTDPALVLCYRDEYPVLLGHRRGDFQVWLAHEWLELVTQKRGCQTETGDCWYLFSHCSETTALPDSGQQWQKIFSRFGARLEVVNTGCCGMAGTYGHETRNLANSQAIFLQSWSVQLQDRPTERCLATGYSCRSQAKRMVGKQLRHPIQALLNILS